MIHKVLRGFRLQIGIVGCLSKDFGLERTNGNIGTHTTKRLPVCLVLSEIVDQQFLYIMCANHSTLHHRGIEARPHTEVPRVDPFYLLLLLLLLTYIRRR
jgi:hypothetical protein